MKRKFIFHAGPTNSGKTHEALERFRSCKSGIYCGPLRLLASEVFQKTNDNVRFCRFDIMRKPKSGFVCASRKAN